MTEKEPMDSGPAFTTDEVSTGYRRHVVSRRLSLTIERGTRTALVGPNGSGKSTTLKTLARLIAPLSGAVYLNGRDINRLPTRRVAREMAILPQVHEVPAELTVMELVEQGRFPHVGVLGMLRRRDDEAIREAIRMTRLTGFVHRPIDTLSGGERQRAWMALALSQRTEILLLDEPTTFLDVGHQLDLLELVSGLNRDRGGDRGDGAPRPEPRSPVLGSDGRPVRRRGGGRRPARRSPDPPAPAGLLRGGGLGGHRPEDPISDVHPPFSDILRRRPECGGPMKQIRTDGASRSGW